MRYQGCEFFGIAANESRLLVFNGDGALKEVAGPEAALAINLLDETGREVDIDAILNHVSGEWRAAEALTLSAARKIKTRQQRQVLLIL